MPHVPPLSNEESGPARAALDALQTKLGRVPNMYRTFAHAPRVLDAAVLMAQAIRTDLDATLRELAYLKVTQMTDCHVCLHYHEAAARRVGVTDRQLRDLGAFEESDAYTLLEKDILRFAEQWNVPRTIWFSRSRIKLCRRRGPNCEDTCWRATMMIEKQTLAMVIIDPATVASKVCEPSGPRVNVPARPSSTPPSDAVLSRARDERKHESPRHHQKRHEPESTA